jgi:hypothetical protein
MAISKAELISKDPAFVAFKEAWLSLRRYSGQPLSEIPGIDFKSFEIPPPSGMNILSDDIEDIHTSMLWLLVDRAQIPVIPLTLSLDKYAQTETDRINRRNANAIIYFMIKEARLDSEHKGETGLNITLVIHPMPTGVLRVAPIIIEDSIKSVEEIQAEINLLNRKKEKDAHFRLQMKRLMYFILTGNLYA